MLTIDTLYTDRGGAAVGRAAWSRRPPLTRERKNQHLPPSRAGRVTFSRTLTRWSTAGRAGRQGFGGLAWPADGGTDGLGRSLSLDPAARVFDTTPPRKRRYGPLSASGFSPSTAKMGLSARSGPFLVRNQTMRVGVGPAGRKPQGSIVLKRRACVKRRGLRVVSKFDALQLINDALAELGTSGIPRRCG